MSAPRKACFAPDQSQARALLKAFDLSPNDWSSFGFGAALAGRQFDRIVVHMPAEPSARDFEMIANLNTRLAKDGSFSIVSPARSNLTTPAQFHEDDAE
ncbi:hypothetical protein [Methylobacterium sp. WL120]|uniref:hypothetical protein n=1 Tax=Methylobacterium sp. WL120 TaxID=2603887 RepID=UPI0011C71BEA|nr:hypothetical protein [Methylobacterium sp. WL120]TXM68175.1 hypothetical protein FV229_08345 [Methylobacterium sp. WL120]